MNAGSQKSATASAACGPLTAATNATSIQVNFVAGTDAQSGVASTQLQRRFASYSGGTCGTFGGWTNLGALNPISPYNDTTTLDGVCYQYQLVTRDNAKNALGADVDGYVMPMFNSQTAIAYNPALVPSPPKSYAELADWAKAHPKQFGYNGIKGGASGVSFVMG